MFEKQTINPDVLYVCGDSWTHGSELIDPTSTVQDHFAPVHETYRKENYWPRLLANMLQLELVDGSVPGASNEYILRTAMYDVLKLVQSGRKPLVIISWTQLQRFETANGPNPGLWRQWVGPAAKDNPSFAMELWGSWSNDYSDTVRWVQQIIALDAFLKSKEVPWFSTTVFRSTYNIFEQYIYTTELKPYYTELLNTVNLRHHLLSMAMETMLQQWPSVTYGPGGHPLTYGHVVLAHHFKEQLKSRFNFQAPTTDQ